MNGAVRDDIRKALASRVVCGVYKGGYDGAPVNLLNKNDVTMAFIAKWENQLEQEVCPWEQKMGHKLKQREVLGGVQDIQGRGSEETRCATAKQAKWPN